MLALRLAGMLSAGLRFDHSMVNDPNLILIQIINLVKSAMIALLPLIAGVVIVALVSPVMLGGRCSAVNRCNRNSPSSTRYPVLRKCSPRKPGLSS